MVSTTERSSASGKIGGSRIEFAKGITLRSPGEASDGLMVTMADLYHVSSAPRRARSSVIAAGGDPAVDAAVGAVGEPPVEAVLR
jgi:hypothetical protein